MTERNPQVPWTDEQWARAEKVIQEEAARARVAAGFLPLVGPLPSDADYVSDDTMTYLPVLPAPAPPRIHVNDQVTVRLARLQVRVFLRAAQMADPDMTSALQMFRRAANVLARLEDVLVFRGVIANPAGVAPPFIFDAVLPAVGGLTTGELHAGQPYPGLYDRARAPTAIPRGAALGDALVAQAAASIGNLEGRGHFGPFAIVLDNFFFTAAQTPNATSSVSPYDRIIPFLGGGPLARSSTLDLPAVAGPVVPAGAGVVVALGAAPVDLVIARDVSLNFLQVTDEPLFLFRVYEKIVLRIKDVNAIETWT